MGTESLPAFVDRVGRRERAVRRAVSTPLLIHTLAVGVVLALEVLLRVRLARITTTTEWSGGGWAAVAHDPQSLLPLLPLVVYVVLWAVARTRAWVTGVGPGHDGWGIMAGISLALLVTAPFGMLTLMFLGALFVLGLGLAVLGLRLHEKRLGVPGLVLMAVGPLANLGTFENHAHFLGPWPTVVVLAVVLLGLAGLTAMVWVGERRVAATTPAVVPA